MVKPGNMDRYLKCSPTSDFFSQFDSPCEGGCGRQLCVCRRRQFAFKNLTDVIRMTITRTIFMCHKLRHCLARGFNQLKQSTTEKTADLEVRLIFIYEIFSVCLSFQTFALPGIDASNKSRDSNRYLFRYFT